MEPNVQSYLNGVPDDRRGLVDQLHELILSLFPHAEVSLQYRMPTYRVGDGWVALANQKHFVSLYTCGYHHIADFKRKHPRIKTGKGCINFKPDQPLPTGDIEAVIRHAIEMPKDTEPSDT